MKGRDFTFGEINRNFLAWFWKFNQAKTMKKLLLLFFCIISIKSFAQIEPWKGIVPGDSCKLDTVCPLLSFNPNEQGLWEIAKPGKVFLDAAFSPEKCFITDSIDSYN